MKEIISRVPYDLNDLPPALLTCEGDGIDSGAAIIRNGWTLRIGCPPGVDTRCSYLPGNEFFRQCSLVSSAGLAEGRGDLAGDVRLMQHALISFLGFAF